MENKKDGSQTGRLFKTIFNPRVWMDFESVKNSTMYLVDGISSIFVVKKSVVQDDKDFERIMEQHGVDEKEVQARMKTFFRMSILMMVLAFAIAGYAGYQFVMGSLHAAGATVVVCCLLVVLAFRYHFWYYQLKSKRLGCTFREWLHRGIFGAKK